MTGLFTSLTTAVIPELPIPGTQGVWAFLGEHLNTVQLLHFFLVSYLVSKLFVRYKLPERFVYWLFEKKHIGMSKLSLILICSTAVLSMIIANVVTLLALLPVILLIQNEITGTEKEKKKLSTLVMLSAIWGANIGGMGMLTGTPANGVLVGMLGAFNFRESQNFTFMSWLTWAIPLTALLCLSGWLVLKLVFKPNHQLSGVNIRQHLDQANISINIQRFVLFLVLFFLVSAALLSFLMSFFWEQRLNVYILTVIWTIVFIITLFILRFRFKPQVKGSALLTLHDIVRDLPKKGLLWILIGLLVTVALYFLGIPKFVAISAAEWVRANYSLLLLMLMFGLVATFFTEVVSNLVIQIALFATLFPLTLKYPDLSWQMMLIITLTSSCAFMSPIATPVNGLGFGASKRISLPYMLLAGFIMNLVSAVLITSWVHFVVPIVLNWFA